MAVEVHIQGLLAKKDLDFRILLLLFLLLLEVTMVHGS